MSKAADSVDLVLDRMVEAVLGEGVCFKSHALALHIPRETIKSWKRRGEVPEGFLKGFALDHKVPLEWLQRGEDSPEQASLRTGENVRPYGLSEDEAALLEVYRTIAPDAQQTLRALLLLISGRKAGARKPARAAAEPPLPPTSVAFVNEPAEPRRSMRGRRGKDGSK